MSKNASSDAKSNSTAASQSKRSNVDPIKSFLAGSVGGACLVVIGHPPDTIKVSSVIQYMKIVFFYAGSLTNSARAKERRKTYLQRSG